MNSFDQSIHDELFKTSNRLKKQPSESEGSSEDVKPEHDNEKLPNNEPIEDEQDIEHNIERPLNKKLGIDSPKCKCLDLLWIYILFPLMLLGARIVYMAKVEPWIFYPVVMLIMQLIIFFIVFLCTMV